MIPNILVIGSLNMDLVVNTPRHPRPGETVTGGPFRTVPGGKGANQAVAAARMGARVTMIGAVGRDAFGHELIASLDRNGVDTTRIERLDISSGVALITVGDDGENTIVIVPGANGRITPEAIERHEDAIATADALLLQLEIPLESVERAAVMAAHHGVPVLLNPAPARPLSRELIRAASYVIPNEHEATQLTSIQASGRSDLSQAAAKLREMGAQGVVLTMGDRGALVLVAEEPVHIAPFTVKAVDTTAAGDAFVGAFAVALSSRHTPEEAARWGCAAGALACTAFGAQPSIPSRDAVIRLIQGAVGP